MSVFELSRVNHFCLHKQHLTGDSKINDIVQITEDIVGLHATSPTTPYLSLLSRCANFTKEVLEEELYVKRTLGKLRSARKTLYVLPKKLIPMIFSAIKGLLEIRFDGYIKYLGITKKEYEKTTHSILDILQDKGMTTNEIKKILGITSNISAVVNMMCDHGLLIRGMPKHGWKSNIHTYYSFNQYFPNLDLYEIDEAIARKLLVEKYISTFGPVTLNDISWWTGFKKGEVRKILESIQDKIVYIEISNLKGEYLIFASDEKVLQSVKIPEQPTVHLLPVLDSYLQGYKDRDRYLSPEHYDYIFDRTGNVTSTILVNGKIAGIWDYSEDKEHMIKLFFFNHVEGDVLEKIHSKASAIGRFIADKEVKIKECKSMVPLLERTMGGFLSPLRDC